MRLNLHSRLAQRVLLQLAHAPYRDERDLYRIAAGVPWEIVPGITAASAAAAQAGHSLTRRGVARRVDETVEAVFDLSSTIGDARALRRGKAFLDAPGAARDNALELIETLLPAPLGSEASRFVADATSGTEQVTQRAPAARRLAREVS